MLLLLASMPVLADTYAGSAAPYTVLAPFTAPCGIGSCANFTTSMSASGTITTAAPLPASLVAQPIRPLLVSFRFVDGLTVYDSTDPNVRVRRADVSTDAGGAITNVNLLIQRWQTGGAHVAGDRLDEMLIQNAQTVGLHDLFCNSVAAVVDPDTCFSVNLDASTSRADGPGGPFALAILAPAPAVALIAAAPTLDIEALLVLGALLALVAGWRGRRGKA